MNSLMLRLAAPMQSWGTQSRFSVRDTGPEPSKSGVVGLLCAAMGRSRDAPIDDLMRLTLSVRIDREGALRRDYQTAGGGRLADGSDYGVAKASQAKPATVTSSRHYLADADFRVAIEGSDLGFLSSLESALLNPVWQLYLGRKAFVPSLPLCLGVREGLTALEALRREPCFFRSETDRQNLLEERGNPPRFRYVLEVLDPAEASDVRNDATLSFHSRDFQLRHVKTLEESLPLELLRPEEEALCISAS